MKKSKLLIPAVGFLMISLAAAGTSTVAWFSSTAAATASLNNLVASKVDGGLKIWASTAALTGELQAIKAPYAMSASTETEGTASNTSTISLHSDTTNHIDSRLRDTSLYFGTTSKTPSVFIPANYYTATDTATGAGHPYYSAGDVYSFKSVDSTSTSWFTSTTETVSEVTTVHNVYNFAKFTLSFKAGDTGSTKAVYFDMANSKINADTSVNIASSIRLAYANNATTTYADNLPKCLKSAVIWAPNNSTAITASTEGTAVGIECVKAAGNSLDTGGSHLAATYGTYYSEQLVNTTNTPEHHNSDNATYHDQVEYLGDVGGSENSTIAISFYIWFEGTDSSCKDANLITDKTYSETLKASLSFYAVDKVADA